SLVVLSWLARLFVASCLLHCLDSHTLATPRALHSFPTRRSSDLGAGHHRHPADIPHDAPGDNVHAGERAVIGDRKDPVFQFGNRSEEHTSELQSREKLVCRLLLEKKNRFYKSYGDYQYLASRLSQ